MRLDMKPPTLSSSTVRHPIHERTTNFQPTDAKFMQRASKSARTGNTLADLMEEVQRKQIAERIRELRRRSPYTQPQIAERMSMTLRGYQKLEAEGTTKWERAQVLAEIHNIDPEWIWTGEEDDVPKDRLARVEAKIDELLARFEGLALERDEEAAARRSAASAEPSEEQERANDSE